jgi:type IV pilus assembly protein PilM
MAKKVTTTLFIRDTHIDLLVMTGLRVEKWSSLPLEPGLVSQGLIVDEDQVADKIKQIFKEAGAQTSKVITAISGHDSIHRVITLPELPEAILPEAVKREAKRTIPTPLEDVYFSYQRIPSPKGENRVFLAAFPRNLVDALAKTLRRAGVSPHVLDLAPLALCRVPNEPRAIIVNARLDHLDVMVIADRLPQVIRRLSLPTETGSLEENVPLIAEEFNRTVAFYNSSHMEKPLDSTVPVFFCGDLAEEPETWQSVVGSKSGYSVSTLPSPVEPPEGFNPNEFMVNIGLALKELLAEKEEANFSIVNFNALPEAYLPEHVSIARILVPVGIVVGIGLIIFGIIFVQNNRAYTDELRSELAIAQSNAAQQQAQIASLKAEVGPLEATANELNSRVSIMGRGRAAVHEDLDEIVRLAGEKISLQSVNHKGSSITVTGLASNEDSIFSYARDLENSGRFKVWISSVTESAGGGSFSLTLTK